MAEDENEIMSGGVRGPRARSSVPEPDSYRVLAEYYEASAEKLDTEVMCSFTLVTSAWLSLL
jgi:hypothetical protein